MRPRRPTKDQNSSATLKYGARARNGAAKARNALRTGKVLNAKVLNTKVLNTKALNAKALNARTRNGLSKIRPAKTVANGHAAAADPYQHELLNALHAMQAGGVTELLGSDDIEIMTADTGASALLQLRDNSIDCVVLDLKLPDMSGFEVLERIRDDASVDDDARNIFALSSVLERRGMEVLTATTGSEAIAVLGARTDVAIVLMDIGHHLRVRGHAGAPRPTARLQVGRR